ncbi:hypothetical protein B0H14DRAFT_2659636 [Mycena olivaceomarginata]|nr:hypothetical protein B0H14DRAFT_2659636 [Mycena olivaceomarginata]
MTPRSGSVVILEGSVLQFMASTRFHFDSLAHDNSATTSTVDAVAVIPNTRGDKTPPAITLLGVHRVLMALFRVEDQRVDLVVTFNVPVASQDHGAVGEEGWKTAQNHFDIFVRSLCIVDFGLFA